MSEFKLPTETVDLPSKGLVYPKDHKLRSAQRHGDQENGVWHGKRRGQTGRRQGKPRRRSRQEDGGEKQRRRRARAGGQERQSGDHEHQRNQVDAGTRGQKTTG